MANNKERPVEQIYTGDVFHFLPPGTEDNVIYQRAPGLFQSKARGEYAESSRYAGNLLKEKDRLRIAPAEGRQLLHAPEERLAHLGQRE